MLGKDQLAKVIERNPRVDPTAVQRSQEVARRLAELGIDLGTYRLEPALGGGILKAPKSKARFRSQQGKK